MSAARFRLAALIAAAPLLAGCGPQLEEFPVAPVTGTVTCNGEPLEGGRIQFSPVRAGEEVEAGKPAQAVIEVTGTFVLSTYARGDGAVVGKHTVSVWPDEVQGLGDDREQAADLAPGCPGGALSGTFTVVEGQENAFEIELSESAAG